MPGRPLLIALCLALAATSWVDAEERRLVQLPGTELGLPFSSGYVSGDLLYLSGAIGNRPGTRELAVGIEAQVRQALDNLQAVLRSEGMELSRAAAVNVFLADARDFAAMNAVYRTYFPVDPPTRATVQADIALPGALVEIAMIAVRPQVERSVVEPAALRSPELPYSWGIRAGSTLFVAGATSRDPETYEPVTGDIGTQTRRVLGNVGLVLEAAGMDFEDVVSCNVFLDDAREFAAMNEAYREFFGSSPPTRATVRAKLMNPAFRSEIQCTAVEAESRQVFVAEGDAPSGSPFSPSILVGDRLYVAGMVGRGPDGYAKGDAAAQTRSVLDRIGATLKAAGMGLENVVSATVYLADIRHYAAMNEVYAAAMPKPPPARATVGAPLMSPDALVEIVVIATR